MGGGHGFGAPSGGGSASPGPAMGGGNSFGAPSSGGSSGPAMGGGNSFGNPHNRPSGPAMGGGHQYGSGTPMNSSRGANTISPGGGRPSPAPVQAPSSPFGLKKKK
jgi:hypothetical protein